MTDCCVGGTPQGAPLTEQFSSLLLEIPLMSRRGYYNSVTAHTNLLRAIAEGNSGSAALWTRRLFKAMRREWLLV